MLAPEWRDAVAQLTADLHLGAPDHVVRLPGGRNNRVYRVEAGGRPLLLKHYHRDPDDPRDRLGADFGFSGFAWRHGVRSIAEPLAADTLYGIALFEFVSGERPGPDDVTAQRIDEAVDFIAAVNRHRGAPDAAALPFASEACFSVADHLDTVEARLQRVHRACQQRGGEAARLVGERLLPLWKRLRARGAATANEAIIPNAERCISPSDFGFHNALLRDGSLVFHDFEYSGWDDPAKLICDFFCQVEVPAPFDCFDAFIGKVIAALGLPSDHRHRAETLLPIYRVKWCCILLNEFLPEAERRRRFAGGIDDVEARRRLQLQRAAALVEQIEREHDGVH